MVFISIDSKTQIKQSQGYLAVSYVWADNQDRVLLTDTVKKYAHKLGISHNRNYKIWLDYESNKGMSPEQLSTVISNMNHIYASSEFVIVLIKTQLETLWEDLYANEWVRRAWTLQEQLVGRRYIIQLNSTFYDITNLIKALLACQIASLHRDEFKVILDKYDKSQYPEYIAMSHNDIADGISYLTVIHHKRLIATIMDIDKLREQAKYGRLDLVTVHSLMASRQMGEENQSYEPMIALHNSYNYDRDRNRIVHLSFLLQAGSMSKNHNQCWRPARLLTTNLGKGSKLEGYYCKDGCLAVIKPVIMRDIHNKFYMIVGEDGDSRIICREINNYSTATENIAHINDTEPIYIDEVKYVETYTKDIVKFGVRNKVVDNVSVSKVTDKCLIG